MVSIAGCVVISLCYSVLDLVSLSLGESFPSLVGVVLGFLIDNAADGNTNS